MPQFADYDDDVPYDVILEAREEQRQRRWRCVACGGGLGHHVQFCPEGDPDWFTQAVSPPDDED